MRRITKIFFLSIIVCLFFLIVGCNNELKKISDKYKLKVENESIAVNGLSENFTIALIADTHVSLCDSRDINVYSKASSRYDAFLSEDGQTADVTFKQLMEYVRALKPNVLVLAGDIVDSAMELSIELVAGEIKKTKAEGIDVIYSMGNHDFEYGSEYFSEKSYSEYLPRFKEISDTSSGFQVKEYDDLIIFLADDGSNKVSKEAAEKLSELSDGDKPVVVVTHVPVEPLTGNSLWQKSINVWRADSNGNSRVLLGEKSCYPDGNTKSFINSITKDGTSVCAVLAGHVHFFDRSTLSENGVIQITTGAGYMKELTAVNLTTS